jgi:type II secretory pathway predicted ATPase ExeA
LSVDDCRQYIKFRLMRAGRMHDLFDDGAVAQVHAYSQGICRRINKIGLLSLLEGTFRGKPMITAEIVEANTGGLR